MKINVLDKKVYNRIAAGEVVERPFSVVKELVENSIDAGAKNITVSIWNGGKDRVQVEDDGCGIEKSELHKAFLPHATSKIADIPDLDSILTLGFRGEALASIASVAKVRITSKPEGQEFGGTISSDGGVVSEVEDAPFNKGTKITVDALFFNTPVRAKFLKTTRAEEGDITDIIGRLILANPFISFKYYVDEKLVVQSYGGGEEDALIAVYGANTARNCFNIATEKNGISLSGYIGRHNFTKANRTYQTLIVNGRYVINTTVSMAMQNAYQSYLMKRQYPFYVLYLNMPSEAVDVNVHPNKTDVRFINNQIIYGAVYSVASKVLDGSNAALSIIKNSDDIIDEKAIEIDKIIENNLKNIKSEIPTTRKSQIIEEESGLFSSAVHSEKTDMSSAILRDSAYERPDPVREKIVADIFAENKKYLAELEEMSAKRREAKKTETVPQESEVRGEKGEEIFSCDSIKNEETPFIKKEKEDVKNTVQTDMEIDCPFVYIGQAFKTYLIFQRLDELYFVDQHAAHERLLYDAIYQKAVSGNKVTQPLLIPYVLELNSIEREYFYTRKTYLEELGFGIEEFGGNSFKITEVPVDIADISLEAFFGDILSDNSLKQEKVPDIIRDKLCQRACKAAIKAGFDLSRDEIDALLRKMNGNMGLKCPHGRPVAVKITQTEIEKWFKRIV